MKIIIHYRETGTSTKMTLTEFPCSVGRAPSSLINLPHESVSANHAVIEKREGAYLIRDLESRNGLTSDGVRLPSVVLNPHTVVSVGNIDIEVIEMTASHNEQTKSMIAPERSKAIGLMPSFLALAPLPIIALFRTYFLGPAAMGFAMVVVAFALLVTFGFVAFSAWLSSFFDRNYNFKKAFLRILWINALYMGIFCIVEFFSLSIAFNLDNAEVWSPVRMAKATLYVSIFLYFYCKEVFFKGHRKTLGIVGAAFASCIGLLFLLQMVGPPERASFAGSITQPLRSFTRENRSLADFDAKMKRSFDKIERERAKDFDSGK